MLRLFILCLAWCQGFAAFSKNRLKCSLSTTASDWTNNARNLNGSRWNPTSQITPQNVPTLTQAWSLNVNSSVSATPAIFQSKLFFPNWNGTFYCLNASTGAIIWSRKDLGLSRSTPIVDRDLVIIPLQGTGGFQVGVKAKLVAVKTSDGTTVWEKQLSDHKYAMLTQSGTRICDVLYIGLSSAEEVAVALNDTCCTFVGKVFAISTRDGSILWETNMTTPEYPGAAVWSSSPAIDLTLGSVFITTGDHYDGPGNVKECLLTRDYRDCVPSNTYGDSILALDLYTGRVKWSYTAWEGDWWNIMCNLPGGCPRSPDPVDFDFAQGAMIWQTNTGKKLVGAGNKGGIFYALDPETGKLIWKTRVGPGGLIGGLQWGSAVDCNRIYVALSNADYRWFTLPNNTDICFGGFGALTLDTGSIEWLVADPSGSNFNSSYCGTSFSGAVVLPPGQTPNAMGPVTLANGVLFGTSLNGYIYAFDAKNGDKLWEWKVPGTVSLNTAPSLSGDSLYFGTGYQLAGSPNFHAGTMFYSFKLPSPRGHN